MFTDSTISCCNCFSFCNFNFLASSSSCAFFLAASSSNALALSASACSLALASASLSCFIFKYLSLITDLSCSKLSFKAFNNSAFAPLLYKSCWSAKNLFFNIVCSFNSSSFINWVLNSVSLACNSTWFCNSLSAASFEFLAASSPNFFLSSAALVSIALIDNCNPSLLCKCCSWEY